MTSLEKWYPPTAVENMPNADAIVVLGGFTGAPETPGAQVEINDGIDRLFYARSLFRARSVLKKRYGKVHVSFAAPSILAQTVGGVQSARLVTLDRIRIIGNETTWDKVIRREIGIDEGDLWRGSELKRARYRIERLGYFVRADEAGAGGRPVFYRTVTLRDSWAKIEKQAMQGQN